MNRFVFIALVLAAVLGFSQKTGPVSVRFTDIASQAGVKDPLLSGSTKKDYVLEVNGSGACWLDYDNDGNVDLYMVNGSTLQALQGKTPRPAQNHLYRNNGNGTFTDVT